MKWLVLALTLALLGSGSAVAADRRVPRGAYGAAEPYPVLLPPCRESFWPVLLNCVPHAVVYPAYDDLYAQNQIRSLRPPKRKPYLQVFTW